MNTVVTIAPDWMTDTLGSGDASVPRVLDKEEQERTSTLAGACAVPVIFEESDEDARFAAELGRRAWRRRAENE